MLRRLICISSFFACLAIGIAAAEEEETVVNQWTFFDYTEERGWFNKNNHGEIIAIDGCESIDNKSQYRLFFTGIFENYSNDRSKYYWLNGGHIDQDFNEVYVYTSMEYFEYVYSFTVDAKLALTDTDLMFCARATDKEPPGICEVFTGKDFWKVIADLCVPAATSDSVEVPVDPVSAKATVVAFYLALGAGDGIAAAKHVIPDKRQVGPLSAQALSGFYGNLRKPLRLLNVDQVGDNKFRAKYTFEAKNGSVCNGVSVSTVNRVDGRDLIAAIRAESGC